MGKPDGIIKVGLVGAAGRMGQQVARHLSQTTGVVLVLAVDRGGKGRTLREVAGPIAPDLPLETALGAAIDREQPNVLVDFTNPGCAADHALSALTRGVAPIIGTSGVSKGDLMEIQRACDQNDAPAMVVPNFAIGAVLMMRFAEMAARWMPDVEIVEMHHNKKVDAPSGTAKRTAEMIHNGRVANPTPIDTTDIQVEGVLGGKYHNVPIHSVRLKGLLAHQTVMFGGVGETLTLRHDSFDRSSFMPGVELCVRKVWDRTGLTIGLESLLAESAS